MFGIGLIEIALVLLVAVIVIGPKDLPIAAKQLGKFIVLAKQTINGLKRDMSDHGKPTSSQDDLL